MNDYLVSCILGAVEGVTEFLPVSSTAHLRLTQSILGLNLADEYWKLYAIFIQLGAILSVAILYRHRLLTFAREALSPAFFQKGVGGMLRHPAGLITIAFLATALPAFLLKKLIGENLERVGVMVGALAVGGILMIVIDRVLAQGKVRHLEEVQPWQALFVGLVQTLSAVFPGTSRSMSTIASGQIAGLSRPIALEFSFLVSIPVMVVATCYDLLKYVKENGAHASLSAHQVGVLALGFVVSFVVAYAVVAWFLAYVRKRGFLPFGLYRVALAFAIYFFLLK